MAIRVRIVWFLAVIVGAASVAAACGGGGHAAFVVDAGADAEQSPFGQADSTPGDACSFRCSSDLHDVLDCAGKVLYSCPPTQGCGATGCVPACEAAGDNPSSRGCDFYALQPETGYPANTYEKCFAAVVSNSWNAPISITVDIGAKTFSAADIGRLASGTTYAPLTNGQLQPGEAAILFLADSTGAACPAPAALHDYGGPTGTAIGDAFHITTTAPVSAYSIAPYTDYHSQENPFGSGTLLLPTTAWGDNYLFVDAHDQPCAIWNPFLQIVARDDATNVKVIPTRDISGSATVSGAGSGTPVTYPLARGQVLQIVQAASLAGSVISADHPIGVWGGHQGMCPQSATSGSLKGGPNAEDEQMLPVKMLGSEYVAVGYRGRGPGAEQESVLYRIVGVVNDTALTYEPAPPAGAPSSVGQGVTLYLESKTPFVVRSQDAAHPFYVGQYMPTMVNDDTGYNGPELANVVPAAQYLQSYVLYAVPGLSETNLVVVRKKGLHGFADVELDCAGVLPNAAWVGVGDYQFQRVDLVEDGGPHGACDNGRHDMKSDAPFSVMVWSWQAKGVLGNYLATESYGYPGGLGLLEINHVVATAPH